MQLHIWWGRGSPSCYRSEVWELIKEHRIARCGDVCLAKHWYGGYPEPDCCTGAVLSRLEAVTPLNLWGARHSHPNKRLQSHRQQYQQSLPVHQCGIPVDAVDDWLPIYVPIPPPVQTLVVSTKADREWPWANHLAMSEWEGGGI